MSTENDVRSARSTTHWLLVLSLVGVDYFSTLAYLPSMAVEAAGDLAPVAAAGVVVATFALALPIYWYVIGRSPDGRGAAGIIEDRIPGWRGKTAVLTLLGFAAADFVITRSLSLADAAVHVLHNPHGQRLFGQLPNTLRAAELGLWPPLEQLLCRILEPQVAVTLILSLISLSLWQLLKRGLTKTVLLVTTSVVSGYLAIAGIVIGSALCHLWHSPLIGLNWLEAIPLEESTVRQPVAAAWWWPWLSMALWSFPQLALGLSGFEMIMTVVPLVSSGTKHESGSEARRSNNTRKLMLAAASVMAVYLLTAVVATTLLIPKHAIESGGLAQHRALSYLAHGSPLADGASGDSINPLFGEHFGGAFDLATILILCLAGATVTLSLQNLLPHYLQRLGMEISWAGRVGPILHVLNLIVLLVTVVFQASPSSQQWAYATSVLVLITAAALATLKDLGHRGAGWNVLPIGIVAVIGAVFFATMTCLTLLINSSGLTIAILFVLAILVTSFISRWIRSTELRFEGFEFANAATERRWKELQKLGQKVLVPHRPGKSSLAVKGASLQREYRLDPSTPVFFIEATLGDPSNFYQKPVMLIEHEGALTVIRVSKCVSVSHVLAAICVELCEDDGGAPEIIFGWSHESPLAANLNFLLLGEGNVPWMVKELVRKAMPNSLRLPRVLIG